MRPFPSSQFVCATILRGNAAKKSSHAATVMLRCFMKSPFGRVLLKDDSLKLDAQVLLRAACDLPFLHIKIQGPAREMALENISVWLAATVFWAADWIRLSLQG